VADLVVVNKADRPGADRAAAELRAMLATAMEPEGSADGRGAPHRRKPKRPEILLASGLTGHGVLELLAALDRRASELTGDAAQAQSVRLARAEAQVTGILLDRTRERLRSTDRRGTTEAMLRAVAAHELDPYSAADALGAGMARDRP
jgi:LAO/AO transport system kinase